MPKRFKLTVEELREFLRQHGATIPTTPYDAKRSGACDVQDFMMEYLEALIENACWPRGCIVCVVPRCLGNPYLAYATKEVEELIRRKDGEEGAKMFSQIMMGINVRALRPGRGLIVEPLPHLKIDVRLAEDCQPLPNWKP